VTVSQRDQLAELALVHRLPGIFATKENVEAGGLMSYGPHHDDLRRRAASISLRSSTALNRPTYHRAAEQIRAGRQPQDRQSTRLKISESFLLRADEVIE
jgi:putative ABC transport system substrate-binding protein